MDDTLLRQAVLENWQRERIVAAAAFLRARFGGNPPSEPRARAIYDGLVEVLDASRRALEARDRAQQAARASASARPLVERRKGERRKGDRRQAAEKPNYMIERRTTDRRSGHDRRRHR